MRGGTGRSEQALHGIHCVGVLGSVDTEDTGEAFNGHCVCVHTYLVRDTITQAVERAREERVLLWQGNKNNESEQVSV